MPLGLLQVPSPGGPWASGSCWSCLPGFLRQPAYLLFPFPLSQSAVSITTGLPIVIASLDTSGMPVSAPITELANPSTTTIPVAVSSSALLKLGTASCCHLVRRVKNCKPMGPSERNLCFFPSAIPVFLPAGPSSAASLGGRKCQPVKQITGSELRT